MNSERPDNNSDVDVSNFSRHLNGHNAPIWWGIIGLILIELSVVSAFTVTYLYLYMQHPQWPPNDIPAPPLLIPTWSMILMLLSCVTMYLAGKAVEKKIRLSTLLSIPSRRWSWLVRCCGYGGCNLATLKCAGINTSMDLCCGPFRVFTLFILFLLPSAFLVWPAFIPDNARLA